MYQRWDLPRNICFQYPISRENTDLFVGRKDKIDLLRSRLTKNSVVLLEGIIGAGKTSFGNFVRFTNKDQFTPTIEIRTEGTWDREDFILNIIAVLIDELENGKTYSKIKNDRLNEIMLKYKDFFINTYNFGIGGGVSGLVQGNFNLGKSKSYSRSSNNTAVQFESDLKEMAKLINNSLNYKKPIIIQLNNLDLEDGFTEDQMRNLFNSIRDVFLFENFSWILTGKTGIYDFFRKSVKKAYEIITLIDLDPLLSSDLFTLFEKRAFFEGHGGVIPISETTLQKIYMATGGSFRKTFVLIDELLSYYEPVPMKSIISDPDISEYFKTKKEKDYLKIKEKKNWHEIIKEIQTYPGITQQEIVGKSQKTQAYISKQLKDLVKNQYCRVEKKKQSSHYFLMNEFAFLNYD